YAAPSIEVSGRGLATRRLDAPGDTVEIMLADDPGRTESTPAVPGDPLDTLLSDVPADALAGLVGGDTTEPDLPEPPGVPTVPGGRSAGRAGPDDGGAAGELVRISLGEVRQAAAGQAIAARAVAVQVQVVAGATASGPGGVVLDLDLAVLEAAAVAPEPGTVGGAGGQADGVDGVDGVDGADRTTVVAAGLPVTGANVDTVLLAGGLLLAAGTALLLIGLHGIHRARRKASS
ncbi:MAG TPA: hypothetical protein VFO77_09330, partial [Actinoplanes sp.]|nr:hypothetical protein [Actinoplanes sp.]